jgi:hypothetical protein
MTMTRTMSFPTASGKDNGLRYTQATLMSFGELSTSALNISLSADEGLDNLSFSIPRANLLTTITGAYTLKSVGAGQTGVVATSYSYYRLNVSGASSASLYLSSQNIILGNLTITAYDAQRRLLSGTYEMRLDNIEDPTDRQLPGPDRVRCNLKVVGSFSNLKLQ